jgi:tetratricopeptide (TPR) repeat protein
MKDCGIRQSQIQLVMVDNHDSTYKQSPGHEETGLNIHRVPTIIVYQNRSELGRIVESPIISLERDLLAILNGDHYKPNYRAVVYLDSLFKKNKPEEFENKFSETGLAIKPLLKNAAELNTYGYVLMAAKALDKAFIVFKLNVLLYPKNSNVYDSLGEYYFNTGNKDAAKENYGKVLELDPKNENAKKMLEKIQ